jgi:hypothetical protein
MTQEKLRAKIYSKIGVLYFKVAEEDIEDAVVDRVIEKWKYADLVEVFKGDELIYTYPD